MPKQVKDHGDYSVQRFAYHLRELSDWVRQLNRIYRDMRLCNLVTQDKPFRDDMPAAFREIATAADKAADNIEKQLDGQVDEWGEESRAPGLVREQVDKLRAAIKYLPELNDFLRFADEAAADKKSKEEKKAAEAATKKPAKRPVAKKKSAAPKTARRDS